MLIELKKSGYYILLSHHEKKTRQLKFMSTNSLRKINNVDKHFRDKISLSRSRRWGVFKGDFLAKKFS